MRTHTGMIQRAALRMLLMVLVASFLLSAIPSTALAQSAVTFTSTADFDAGTKADLGAQWFAQNGIDQPSNWINGPRSWYASGKTYTVWQGDTDYKIYITYYDHTAQTWATPVVVVSANAVRPDGHGSPALGITNDGYLHVFCCAHGTQIDYYRSTSPNSIAAWTNRTASLAVTLGSYPHVEVLPSGALYLFYREGVACGASGFFDYKTSANSGTSWSAARILINFGVSACAYVGNTEQRSNRVYMSWTRGASAVERNVYSGYLNLATDHMVCGVTDLGVTIDDTENTASCLAVTADAAKETGSCCVATHTDSSNNVYVIYSRQNGSSSSYDKNFTRWTGAAWSAQQFIVKTDFHQDVGDFRVFSPTDVRAYLITPGVGNSPNGESGDLDEYRWNGATWTFNQRIMAFAEGGRKLNSNSEGLNYAQIVRNFNAEWWLTFASRVFYASPADGKLYAYGDGGFVRRPAVSAETTSTETITDNGKVASGVFQLETGLGDTFSNAASGLDSSKWFWMQSGAPTGAVTHDISGGVMRLGAITSSGFTRVGAVSRFRVTGDFDVRIKIAKQDTGTSFNTGNYVMLLNEQLPDYNKNNGGTATVDGVVYERNADTTLKAQKITDGVATAQGGLEFPAFPNCERITRTIGTNTITWYHATGDCSVWTTHTSAVFATTTDLFVVFASWNNAAGGSIDARYDFDDFLVFAGDVKTGGTVASQYTGYGKTGSWTSATKTYVADIPRSVSVTYSGASASAYIDAIAIVDASGNVIYQDGTDRTSGTSATANVPASSGGLHQNWAVRVSLAGSGSASPTVSEVSISLGPDPNCLVNTQGGGLLFLVFPIVVALGIVMTVVGVWAVQHEHIEIGQLIPVMVGFVIMITAVAVIFPPLFAVSTACG
jgi:hypothetical protein